ncbi:STAS domain-containing protein [uncultured Sphingomonas sp.]|mgnify:CR=1 FL=1|uniref:STAS domain-containing protein n=1 Tax=uncultured Sphingomonas sp. TaxID=158754 RepID=UPI0025E86194|nr:STAS domain-containing protein [uncultured Sphingomonas sp.]
MSITTVMASENLCLPNIGVLAEELSAAIAPGATVRLDLSDVAAPDLSVIQLVQSARVSAAEAPCDFALTAPVGDGFRTLLERAGFLPAATPDHAQFWFHGDTVQ